MAAGAVAVFVSYWAQDAWSIDANLVSAATAGFTGSTTGAMASLLAVISKPAGP
jgi:hypothetical protein